MVAFILLESCEADSSTIEILNSARNQELGARMTEPDGIMQVREEAIRGKAGKGKAIIKRKTEAASAPHQVVPVEGRPSANRPTMAEDSRATEMQDPQVMTRIQQRAYRLFEAGGCRHGHDLEHWLEAERQIRGSSDRSER